MNMGGRPRISLERLKGRYFDMQTSPSSRKSGIAVSAVACVGRHLTDGALCRIDLPYDTGNHTHISTVEGRDSVLQIDRIRRMQTPQALG